MILIIATAITTINVMILSIKKLGGRGVTIVRCRQACGKFDWVS